MTIDVSIIIPCKNEEENIDICLISLLNQERCSPREIIVIDNGSTDKTLEILHIYQSKIKVLSLPDVSISAVRNFGARHATGSWLAFIDADVEVDKMWCVCLREFLAEMVAQGIDPTKVITGSRCFSPEQSTWVESVWVNHLRIRDKQRPNYINSGHLIIHRSLFESIGGFDLEYKTGEDEKLCLDGNVRDAAILDAPCLRVTHLGYPKTLAHFFRRERWHGLGMERYLRTPWKNRDLLLGGFPWLLVIINGFFSVYTQTFSFSVSIISFFLYILPLLMIAYIRNDGTFRTFVLLSVLFVVYGMAKMIALIDIFKIRLLKLIRYNVN